LIRITTSAHHVDVWEIGTTAPDINNVESEMEMRAQLRIPADYYYYYYSPSSSSPSSSSPFPSSSSPPPPPSSSSSSSSSSPSSSSALQLFVSFGLLNYFFPFLPLLRPLFPIIHSHLPRVIPHIVFPSYSWPSLRSCCIRIPFVFGLGHSLFGHSFYMPPTSPVVCILYILLYFRY